MMARRTSFPRATSLQVRPSRSRRVSSMPSWSRRRLTTSARPREAARWRAVVPEPAGWTAFGEIERWESSSETVSAGGRVSSYADERRAGGRDGLDAHRRARWRAAAATSVLVSWESRRAVPNSARKGWMRAGSPGTAGAGASATGTSGREGRDCTGAQGGEELDLVERLCGGWGRAGAGAVSTDGLHASAANDARTRFGVREGRLRLRRGRHARRRRQRGACAVEGSVYYGETSALMLCRQERTIGGLGVERLRTISPVLTSSAVFHRPSLAAVVYS